jgi:hypothetical protein
VARHVRKRGECRGSDRKRADREAIEAVGQVHGVRCADEHDNRKEHVAPAQVGNQRFEERENQPRVVERRLVVVRQVNQHRANQQGHDDLAEDLVAPHSPS